MNGKNLLLGVMLSVGGTIFAQNADQRAEIRKNINVAEVSRARAFVRSAYELDEKKVAAYLIANPTARRSEEKNGDFYYIKSIDERGKPLYIKTKSNIASAELIKADALYSGGNIGANITGTGLVIGIWDGGQARTTHELLSGQITMMPDQPLSSTGGNNHMTHCVGTMVGKQLAANNTNFNARGIAHNATALCYDWNNDLAEMTDFATPGRLISGHSYGYGNGPTQSAWTFGAYDSAARNWDLTLKGLPHYLPFVAGGNEQAAGENGSGKTGALQGYDVITGASASKNVITVGAVNANGSMSTYSNFGPTDDGRIKPDICARGTAVNSSVFNNDTAYSLKNGTSMATPAAAAAGLLLQQYYFSLNGTYMSAAMLKALMLHSAEDAGRVGPDAQFGWGILNIERAAQIIKDDKFSGKARMHTFTTNPAVGDVLSISGIGNTTATTGHDGVSELRASICWTDDEGVAQTESDGVDPTDSRLVYNFDLVLKRHLTNSIDETYGYRSLSMANPTQIVTLGNAPQQNNVDNYKRTFSVPAGVEGGQYSLDLKKVAGPSATRIVACIITGLAEKTSTTTWNGTEWSNGLPNIGTKAIINGNYSGPSIEASTVDVTGNAVVTIASGNRLSISGALNVASTASLTVSNNANLLQTQNVANVGNINVVRNSSPLVRLDYSLWSSPVVNQNLLTFSPLTTTNRFYNYNTTTNEFNAATPSTTNFDGGKGYLIRMPNTHPTTATIWSGTFTGIPRNGDIIVPLANIAANQRFNLVGNPYPSTINMTRFMAGNTGITSSLYFWRTANSETVVGPWSVWNAGTFVSSGGQGIVDPKGIIQVGQGFIVEATATGNNLVFNNGMRVANNDNQFFRLNNAQEAVAPEMSRIWLNLTNSAGKYNQMAVSYIDGGTNLVDNFDAKILGETDFSLTSKIQASVNQFVIQSRATPFVETDVVGLQLKIADTNIHSISVANRDGIFANANQSIFIHDKLNNTFNDITTNAYSFTSAPGIFANRFDLVYVNGMLSNPTFNADSNVVAFVKDNTINIETNNSTVIDDIQVYDSKGSLLYEKKQVANSNHSFNFSGAQQVLILKIRLDGGQVVAKKIVN